MAERPYFYKEDGKTKMYRYCGLCGKGPFTEEEVQDKMTQMSRISYMCNECSGRIHSSRREPVLLE